MTEFDFQATEEVAQKEYNLGKGQYFKPKEGDNKFRLVSACLPHDGEYQGKATFKWLCQILDRTDGQVKPYFMPHKVYEQIRDLQLDEEYKFTTVPMPYDLNLKTTEAGKMTVTYTIIPARQSTPLTTEEQNLITSAPSIKELQQKVREKAQESSLEAQNTSLTADSPIDNTSQAGDESNPFFNE